MSNNPFTDMVSSLMAVFIRSWARLRLPTLNGYIRSPSINNRAEIIRDQWGIPHIYAQNELDLFFVQGFAHAQDRFWQMEFNRRLVAGRLAEILGEVAVPVDRWMRILTIRRVAEFETILISSKTRALLQAYANGINFFLAKGRTPIENLILRYKPEPWLIEDSVAWIKMMAWQLSVNWDSELLRALLIARLGPEKAAELEPPYLSRWPYVIPPGTDYNRLDFGALELSHQAKPFSGPSPYDGLGSNNWVLSGAMTTTGKPILANDMHLGMTVPAVWYENHLSCPGLELYGVTFPGIPGIVSGHNGHVAWGFTNGFADVQDLYIERLRHLPDGSVEAEYNGNWEKTRLLREVIHIKNGKPLIEEVVVTRHGPIINPLAQDYCGDENLAMQWTALDPDTMIEVLTKIGYAKDIQAFEDCLRQWTTPSQNVVYADTHGNIGFTLAGKIPTRPKGTGRIPVPGWTGEYEWGPYVPFDALPHLENPSQGYIVTANNVVVGPDYPIRLDIEPINGDRAQRIAEMILDQGMRGNREKIDLEFCKRMQFDLCSPSARVVSRFITQLNLPVSAHSEETDLQAIQQIFREWDGALNPKSPAAAIYEVLIRQLIGMILREKLDPDNQSNAENLSISDGPKDVERKGAKSGNVKLALFYMGKGPTPVLAEYSLFGERWLAWLIDQLSRPDSAWSNLGGVEKRDDIVKKALQQSADLLKKRLGSNLDKWAWGRLHKLTFTHTLGANSILKSVFNVGPFSIGGDNTTVWASVSNLYDLNTGHIVGPPYRMIVDLSDLNNSVAMLAPGQSGNLASPHYRDQVRPWFKGEYHPMLINRASIEEQAAHRLIILQKQHRE
jgi:penicillin amidase